MASPSSRITAIVLAAGGSSRFGSPKQLHIHDGKPLVLGAAEAAMEAGADPVIVVLGAGAAAVGQALEGSPVRTVVNTGWATGIASSLATGLKAADDSCDGILVLLADQPLVDAGGLRTLISAFGSPRRIVASSYAGTVGVPAIFGIEFRDVLLKLEGDTGAGRWIRARMSDVTVVRLDAAGVDVDTQSDAMRLEESTTHE